MSGAQSAYRRVSRRETHSPRSGAAITIAVVLSLAAAYVVTEIVLDLIGQPPLLTTMTDAAASTIALDEYPAPIVAAAGAVVTLIGLALVIHGIRPGRRPKHLIDSDRSVTVVDYEVVASDLARHAAFAGGVDPDNVDVSVSRSRAVVRLTPASGIPADKSAVEDAVRRRLEALALRGTLRSQVIVGESGKVGA
ncbi:Asp23/Gls24 family envelope stress response protein [Marisediminicola senii]|uniref:DUF6286 domain-containing protein n=1 Tax=Marisediminicola senii TaxID=2711233 RepID=UPI0013EBA7C1|nr:DUF6286 domain-containing protein [Marisediminicola senii]